MTTNPTPAPWAYDPEINRVYSVPSNLCVATPHVATNPACMAQWPADARLIAAAPDMLAALKSAFQHHPSAFVLSYGLPLTPELEAKPEIMALRAVLAAIAKAEGR